MATFFGNSSRLLGRAFLFGLAVCAAVAAHADAKIVSTIHSMVMGNARPDMSVTTYYKGDLMRSDVNGVATLFNAKTGKVTLMDPDKKTYADLNDNPDTAMKIGATAQVTPSDEHKMIAGYNTTKYVAKIHMVLTQDTMTQNMDMEMDVWASTDLKSPFVSAHLVRALGSVMRGATITGMQQFTDEMAKIKGYPLEQTLALQPMAGMPASASSGPMMTFDSLAASVDESALSDDLFTVPAGFKKVKSSDILSRTGHR